MTGFTDPIATGVAASRAVLWNAFKRLTTDFN
jgi:hypothetical protein